MLSLMLEAALLKAVIQGKIAADFVRQEELSKPGRAVHQAVARLGRAGKPPHPLDSVFAYASEVLGAETDGLKRLIGAINESEVGAEVAEILSAVREQTLLVDLSEQIGKQLASGEVDLAALIGMLSAGGPAQKPLVSAADLLKAGIPPAPSGPAMKSLPRISQATGGMFGMWALGGEPAVGKTTLAWQIALEVGRVMPVLFYDLDETGAAALLHRAARVARGKRGTIEAMLGRVYMRETVRTLAADMATIPAPALLVIDSLQALPTQTQYRRVGLDQWLTRFKTYMKQGYTVLCVSELQRASYGDARMSGYKETGEIEYAASLACQMVGESQGGTIAFHVVKNRHRPQRGLITYLCRDGAREYWFREEDTAGEEVD